ncbi:MAG: hypothetical protein K6U89_09360, partial [Chloroflexi bacterium]|nr:hypothetical protein [Chloroflexota bacterium]
MSANSKLIASINEIILGELSSAKTYRVLARREKDPQRKSILDQLAKAEGRHAEDWIQRLVELGGTPPHIRKTKPLFGWQTYFANVDAILRQMEKHEEEAVSRYLEIQTHGDESTSKIAERIIQDEREHKNALHGLYSSSISQNPTEYILKRERWHVRGGSW